MPTDLVPKTSRMVDIRITIPKHKTRKWTKRQQGTINRIVVHTTDSNNQDPANTALYHVTPGPKNHLSTKGAPGLCYHDFIDKKGIIYHCNNYLDITWHSSGWNASSIGVTLAYSTKNGGEPTAEQYKSLISHLVVLCLYLKIEPNMVFGHREAPWMYKILSKGTKQYKKECPGMKIDLDKMRNAICIGLQERLYREGLYCDKIDGIFGTKSKLALKNFNPLSGE